MPREQRKSAGEKSSAPEESSGAEKAHARAGGPAGRQSGAAESSARGSVAKGALASRGKDSPDRAQFAVDFQAAYRVLWLIAVGIIGDRSGADDVVQEAALLALEKLDQFQPGTNFRAWMAQMVRFVALNHARRQQKHRNVGEVMATHSPTTSISGAAVAADVVEGRAFQLGRHGELPADQSHFDDRLVLALNSVGDVPRACLLLRTIEQLEYAEISRLLGIPEGTAMSHVHRTRQYLRDRLSDLAPLGSVKGGGA